MVLRSLYTNLILQKLDCTLSFMSYLCNVFHLYTLTTLFCYSTSSLNQWLLVLLAVIILYNERLALDLAARSWGQLPMTPAPDPNAPAISAHHSGVPVRLLLVSDPQILSTLSEPHYPLSVLSVWDANRLVI